MAGHQFPLYEPSQPPEGPWTLDDLKKHLQTALILELYTIPLYLFGWYSINKVESGDPKGVIRTVSIDEMLHLALSGNILTAIGGSPKLYDTGNPSLIPQFPSKLFYEDAVDLSLRAATKPNIETFVLVEKPYPPYEPYPGPPNPLPDYRSIGEFYEAVKTNIIKLNPVFGAVDRQFSPEDNVHKRVITIPNLDAAKKAIDTIIAEGEGASGQPDPNSHYEKFKTLWKDEKIKWDCYSVKQDPQTERDYKGKKFYRVARTFDATFCFLLLTMEILWTISSSDDNRARITSTFKPIMRVLSPLADFLVKEQFDANTVAAPSFDFYKFVGAPAKALDEVNAEIAGAIEDYKDDETKQKALKSIQLSISKLEPLP